MCHVFWLIVAIIMKPWHNIQSLWSALPLLLLVMIDRKQLPIHRQRYMQYVTVWKEYMTHRFSCCEYQMICIKIFQAMSVSVCHYMTYINFSWWLSCAKAGNLELIFVNNSWRSASLIWQLVTKCSSFSISRQNAHSLWSGSIFGRVYLPRSISRSCELALIFDIDTRYLGKVMQSR